MTSDERVSSKGRRFREPAQKEDGQSMASWYLSMELDTGLAGKRYVTYLTSTLQKRLLRTVPTVAEPASAVATHMPSGLEVVFA